MADVLIRPARTHDAQAVCGIYAWHVAGGTATFDTLAPEAQAWAAKIEDFGAYGWPFLVAERDAQVVGYAYAARFRDRAAYARTCEDSIYIANHACDGGIGTALMRALLLSARAAGFEQMIAVIGGGEPASVSLHAKCGFVHAGRLRNVGHKFGRVLDTVYMQCDLTGQETDR